MIKYGSLRRLGPALLLVAMVLLSHPLPGFAGSTTRPGDLAEDRPASGHAASTASYSYPIGTPGRPLGDGFFVRHGYAVENTWYLPDYWHAGEDWYAIDGSTAGARVYAVAAGTVVYAGANYPGRVVIIKHGDGLFSMYGHLDPELEVAAGEQVRRGTMLGRVLRRSDKTPNHLHFEIRAFLTTNEVNGANPRYNFRCGVRCPPGPGYWPIRAPDHPSAQGWRNPTHVIARRAYGAATAGRGEVVVARQPASGTTTIWSHAPGASRRTRVGEMRLQPGARFQLLNVLAGAEAGHATSARGYELWYQIRLGDGRDGWVQAALPSTYETGGDGRPATVRFSFYPWVVAER
jgi:hypothetical protein